MKPFYSKFEKLAETETRVVQVINNPILPVGEYGFIEFYCDIPSCDCNRVILKVFSETIKNEKSKDKLKSNVLATISYGWKDEYFYQKLLNNIDQEMPKGSIKGPFLDSINPQSEYSQELLNLFKESVLTKEYESRLIRHYSLFRSDIQNSVESQKINLKLIKNKLKKSRKIKKQKKKQKKMQRRK